MIGHAEKARQEPLRAGRRAADPPPKRFPLAASSSLASGQDHSETPRESRC